MKIVDSKLMFLNSSQRSEGSINNFTLLFPKDLVSCNQRQFLRMTLIDFTVKYQWYNIQTYNNSFEVLEQQGATTASHTVSIPEGNYDILELTSTVRDGLNSKLTLYTVSTNWNSLTSKTTYTATPNAGDFGSLTFSFPAGSAYQ